MNTRALSELTAQLAEARDSLLQESFIRGEACDRLIQALLHTFFLRRGCIFSLTTCPRRLEARCLAFFGPDGVFLRAVYRRYTLSRQTMRMPLGTISRLYAELNESQRGALPQYYQTKLAGGYDGDLRLNVLEFTFVVICSAAINSRVSSTEDNIGDVVRPTPYTKLMIRYMRALRQRSETNLFFKPLSPEDVQHADSASQQQAIVLSPVPFTSGVYPRSVGDLFIFLATDCWFARNLPIGTAEQLYYPFSELKQRCAEVEIDESDIERRKQHSAALISTNYRTVAHDCTPRLVADYPCFLTNILDLALLFARFVVSPAASLDYGCLRSTDYISEAAVYRFRTDWATGTPPHTFFQTSLEDLPMSHVTAPPTPIKGVASAFYIRRNYSPACFGALLTTASVYENMNDGLQNASLEDVIRRYTPEYSEVVEQHVLPIFYAFLRSLFQGEPIVKKIYLYYIETRLYAECLAVDPCLLREQPIWTTERYAVSSPQLVSAIAIRAPFFSDLFVEWSRNVGAAMIETLSDALDGSMISTVTYGRMRTLLSCRKFYGNSYSKPLMYLAAAARVVRATGSPTVRTIISLVGMGAAHTTPFDIEMGALMFTTRGRALATYSACEACLARQTSPATKQMSDGLVDCAYLARGRATATGQLVADSRAFSHNALQQFSSTISTPANAYLNALPLLTRGAGGYAWVVLTSYIGLLDFRLAGARAENLPHPASRLFHSEYGKQVTILTSIFKTCYGRANQSTSWVLNQSLFLQSRPLGLELWLLRLFGIRNIRSEFVECYGLPHLYRLVRYAFVASGEDLGSFPVSQTRSGRLLKRPVDVKPSTEYQKLREYGAEGFSLAYLGRRERSAAAGALRNSQLAGVSDASLTYSMLCTRNGGASVSSVSSSHTGQAIRPDEIGVLVIILDAIGIVLTYVLSLLMRLLSYPLARTPLGPILERGLVINLRILASKRVWGALLLLAILYIGGRLLFYT
ncbi:hypothetical protein GMRT_15560 [Giardia muris]|uniref:Uncharacterized protein n=1 Tax=Giardia muris TaxID=5742 RepID=A0A4Z1SZE5_GIAMU|nr:hypothetical protein GMRT_15560 [Giardia muris]|eukprot:TNJ28848.1 hypothetical protein GMRT_15560 [Giardia muris]